MKKYLAIALVFLMISCNNKIEMALPKADVTVLKEVVDHSPVYIFFKVEGKDTIADLNRKNTIGTTNWIFNIDKKLPVKAIIPEIVWLQNKKKNGMHTNDEAENYYSYADSIGKNLAFVPFTKIEYKLEQPKSGVRIYFTKNNKILVSDNQNSKGIEVKKEDLLKNLLAIPSDKPNKFFFCHDKNSSYEKFLQSTILIGQIKLQIPTMSITNEEFVY